MVRIAKYLPHEVSESVAPLTERHVSLAFRSDATRQVHGCIQRAVKDSSGNVIGVFCRTAHLGELQVIQEQRLKSETDDSVRRVIALIDSRDWQVLDHPYLTKSNTIEDGFSRKIFLDCTSTRQQSGIFSSGIKRRGLREVATSCFRTTGSCWFVRRRSCDSIQIHMDGSNVTVSVANMEAPWMVIVQEERSATLQPIQDMAKQATKQAWLAVFAALGMMGLIWATVWRAFNRSEHSIGYTNRNSE